MGGQGDSDRDRHILPFQGSQRHLISPLLVVRVPCSCTSTAPCHHTKNYKIQGSTHNLVRAESSGVSLAVSWLDTVPCSALSLLHHTAVLWGRVWGHCGALDRPWHCCVLDVGADSPGCGSAPSHCCARGLAQAMAPLCPWYGCRFSGGRTQS